MRWDRRRLQQTAGRAAVDRSPSGKEPFLLHLGAALGPARVPELRAALHAVGAVLGSYLPHDTYLVFAPRSAVAALHAMPGESAQRSFAGGSFF